MDVIFINLDRELERRGFVEENFAKNNSEGWRLHRLSAVDASKLETAQGTHLSKGEIGCYRSHEAALRRAEALPGHVFIAEDDILFGPQSQQIVAKTLAALPADAWDLLYTDVCIPDVDWMVKLYRLRTEARKEGRIKWLDLASTSFAGSTAYVVNERSKAKVARLTESAGAPSAQWDLSLRELVHRGQLKALAIFPFATSLSSFSEQSLIQPRGTEVDDFMWNAFRKLVWVHADIAGAASLLDRIEQAYEDASARLLGRIIAGLIASDIQHK